MPGGFALATRLEQIEPDGTPKRDPQRWASAMPEQPVASLGDYLRVLFSAPSGDYRVIVFVVSNRTVATTGTPATNAQAQAWVGGGADHLPSAVRRQALDADTHASALIYQFRKRGASDPPVTLQSSDAPAARQLERTGISAALRR